jgi:hypothetical protein
MGNCYHSNSDPDAQDVLEAYHKQDRSNSMASLVDLQKHVPTNIVG